MTGERRGHLSHDRPAPAVGGVSRADREAADVAGASGRRRCGRPLPPARSG